MKQRVTLMKLPFIFPENMLMKLSAIINSTDEENVKHLMYMNVFCPSNTSQEKKSYCSPSLGQVDT